MTIDKKIKPCIHVGYPRAGSTSLQRNLFNKHSELNYLGVYSKKYEGGLKEFYSNIIKLSNLSYRYSKTEELFKRVIEPYLENYNGVPMFSLEDFISSWYSDNEEKAKRLKHFFPEGKIIIVIRNQLDIICSLYDHINFIILCDRQKNHSYGPLGPGSGDKILSLDEWLRRSFLNLERSSLIGFKYYEIAKAYSELFGKENVGIFLFEELANDLDLFAKKLSGFIGIDFKQTKELLSQPGKNSSTTEKYMNLLKFKKRFLPFLKIKKIIPPALRKQLLQFLQTGKSKKSELNEHWRKELSKLYADSNKKLQDELKLDIGKYKYPL
jgi:hypothetical protein